MGSASCQKKSLESATVMLQKFYQIDILVTTEYICILWKCPVFHQSDNTSNAPFMFRPLGVAAHCFPSHPQRCYHPIIPPSAEIWDSVENLCFLPIQNTS